jgi:excisionase family DNA binding protein
MRHLETLYTTPQAPRPQAAPLLVSHREAARMLSVCERTLYSLVQAHEIRVVRIGRGVRYSVEDLKAWIKKKCGDGQNCT